MLEFADEARPRLAQLLRMASDDPKERERIRRYAAATPEPPALARFGIATRGCRACHGTMWQQGDRHGTYWVCSACGTLEDCR